MQEHMYRPGEDLPAVVMEQQPADAINAQDLCPLLWALLEDTAAQGFVSPGEWKAHLLGCTRCQVQALNLMKQATEEMDVDPATRMFTRTLVKKAVQLMEQVAESKAILAAQSNQLSEGQAQ